MGKKQQESTEGKSKLQISLEKLDKSYGKGTVLILDSRMTSDYDVISTGSIGFDWITLGIGGFVKGKMYELMGWEGTGKSTICGHVVAECQKKGGKALYIDGEHALDKNYFRALGVDTTNLYISQPSNGEEGFNIAKEMIASDAFDLIIIDSDSSLIPKAVVDGEVGDSAIGKKARLNNNAYPMLKNMLVEHNVCLIIVSQYREKIGMMFGNPTTTQGGHALKFYTDCRIEISRTLGKEGDVAYGNITKVKSTKNKMSSPYRAASFDIVFGVGIDKHKELIELCTDYDVIKKSGSWYSYGESRLAQGTEQLKTLLQDNPELEQELKSKVIAVIKNTDIPVEIDHEM